MAAYRGALTVASYPNDLVRLACTLCGRAGQYRRVTLLQRFGSDATMPDVLRRIAACPRVGNPSNPCEAHYPDLSKRPAASREDGGAAGEARPGETSTIW